MSIQIAEFNKLLHKLIGNLSVHFIRKCDKYIVYVFSCGEGRKVVSVDKFSKFEDALDCFYSKGD
jgi:hypothetical protein